MIYHPLVNEILRTETFHGDARQVIPPASDPVEYEVRFRRYCGSNHEAVAAVMAADGLP